MMPDSLPPASIYFLGAILIPFFRGQARQVFALLVPLVGFANYFTIDKGIDWTFELLDFELILFVFEAWAGICMENNTVPQARITI